MNMRFSFLRNMFPQSLGGQLLVMLLLALAATQGLGLLLLTDERNRAVRAALGLEAAGRAANVVLLLDNAPADLRPSILRAADSPLVRFVVGPEPEAPHDSAESDVVLRQIRQILGEPEREVRADVHALPVVPMPMPDGMPAAMRPMHEAMMDGRTEPVELTLSIRLAGGDWLNVRTMFHRPGPAACDASPFALVVDDGCCRSGGMVDCAPCCWPDARPCRWRRPAGPWPGCGSAADDGADGGARDHAGL